MSEMNENILVSVIVPIYNVEQYLSKCISSIIHQTYPNIQILLVDDGSTDNSGKICDNFARLDRRIKVIHKNNGGLVSARKAGLSVAQGDYIGFVDGDDDIDEAMYENLLKNLVFTGADFVHSGYHRNKIAISQLSNKVVDINENKHSFLCRYIFSRDSEEFMSYSIWSKLFRADFIRDSYSEVPDWISEGEDLINLIACIMKGRKVSFLNASYYNYNNRPTSIVNDKDDSILLNFINVFQTIVNLLKKYGCYNAVEEILTKEWLKFNMYYLLARVSRGKIRIECYRIGDMGVLLNKRIVLYGAGVIGQSYYSQISLYQKCEIVAWIDMNYENISFDYAKVVGLEALRDIAYDIILIANKYKVNAQQIKDNLIKEGIDEKKIVWIEPKQA